VDLGGTSTGFVEVVLVIHCDCFFGCFSRVRLAT
jgi:hypothetical protein